MKETYLINPNGSKVKVMNRKYIETEIAKLDPEHIFNTLFCKFGFTYPIPVCVSAEMDIRDGKIRYIATPGGRNNLRHTGLVFLCSYTPRLTSEGMTYGDRDWFDTIDEYEEYLRFYEEDTPLSVQGYLTTILKKDVREVEEEIRFGYQGVWRDKSLEYWNNTGEVLSPIEQAYENTVVVDVTIKEIERWYIYIRKGAGGIPPVYSPKAVVLNIFEEAKKAMFLAPDDPETADYIAMGVEYTDGTAEDLESYKKEDIKKYV